MRLLFDNIAVQIKKEEPKSASGIILSTEVPKDVVQGVVVAVGEGKISDGKRMKMTVACGDTVLFKKFAPVEITVDKQIYLVFSEDAVIAII